MKTLIINVRGCSGSGKSTFPTQIMQTDPDTYTIAKPFNGKSKEILTICPNNKFVLLGVYGEGIKTGGLDKFSNNGMMKKVFRYAAKKFPDYDILLEGNVASSVKTLYAELLLETEKRFDYRKGIVLSLTPPVKTCYKRVLKRNGGKPINKDRLQARWDFVDRNVGYFEDRGLVSLRLDTSKIMKDEMLDTFLAMIEEYR